MNLNKNEFKRSGFDYIYKRPIIKQKSDITWIHKYNKIIPSQLIDIRKDKSFIKPPPQSREIKQIYELEKEELERHGPKVNISVEGLINQFKNKMITVDRLNDFGEPVLNNITGRPESISTTLFDLMKTKTGSVQSSEYSFKQYMNSKKQYDLKLLHYNLMILSKYISEEYIRIKEITGFSGDLRKLQKLLNNFISMKKRIPKLYKNATYKDLGLPSDNISLEVLIRNPDVVGYFVENTNPQQFMKIVEYILYTNKPININLSELKKNAKNLSKLYKLRSLLKFTDVKYTPSFLKEDISKTFILPVRPGPVRKRLARSLSPISRPSRKSPILEEEEEEEEKEEEEEEKHTVSEENVLKALERIEKNIPNSWKFDNEQGINFDLPSNPTVIDKNYLNTNIKKGKKITYKKLFGILVEKGTSRQNNLRNTFTKSNGVLYNTQYVSKLIKQGSHIIKISTERDKNGNFDMLFMKI